MSKRCYSKHSRHGADYSSSEDEKKESVDWVMHKRTLNDLFFRENDFIQRDSQKYEDFWKFLERYEAFQRKSNESGSSSHKERTCGNSKSPKLGLPTCYDKRYKINVSILSRDITDALPTSKTHHRGSAEKGRRTERGLSASQIADFRSILLFYIDFCQKQNFAKLVKLKKDQSNLPISQFRQQIIDAVSTNQVVIIAGDTGCGKSTQVPHYLLQAGFTGIACTQPRRIACISLAKRVGYETLHEYGSEVAYQVRFEASKTRETRILFLTEGLLLRQLASDPTLSRYNVIVADEVHERHLHGDFLLGVLRCLLQARGDLKLVLMSATININLFAGYFAGSPVIQVPGRLYPIEVRYMPPSTEQGFGQSSRSERLDPSPFLRILQLIDHKYPATERGDLLIFQSGMSEIAAIVDAARQYAQRTRRWIVLPLHSSLSVEEQDKVFDVSPDGVRKCIVSTNIAETSITIDGIRFIVDSGKVKEMNYDQKAKMQRLQEFWISQASAEQRKGRAGRTGPGVCFRLFSESDYAAFSEYATPEIQRAPLDSIILQMVSLGIHSIREFSFIEPPPQSSVENSVYCLKQQGALSEQEYLTPIGKVLAQLPVDVVIGKMLVMASMFHLTEPALIIAAALSVQSPYTRRMDYDSDVTSLRRTLESDHGDPFTLLKAYDEWLQAKSREGSTRKWCKRRGLEEQRFYEMSKLKKQFEELLQDRSLLKRDEEDDDEDFKRHKQKSNRRELKRLRRERHQSSRRRKLLKLEDDEQSSSEEETGTDIRHLEFKLTHDLDKLHEASTARRTFTLRDINLLKIILCSGLYPNIAIPDESNCWKSDSEQLFHTRNKPSLLLHPTSVFATQVDVLQLEEPGTSGAEASGTRSHFSSKHQLLTFVSLLETNKPYLVNVMRVPALQTLLLFAHSLDTNADVTRIVTDSWLELRLSDSATGQKVLSAVQQLRVSWLRLLQLQLQEKNKHGDVRLERDRERDLERTVARKLAEFLDSRIRYSIRRLLSSEQQHLYVGPDSADGTPEISEMSFASCAGEYQPHPTKGGVRLNDYLTYACLLDSDKAEAASQAAQCVSKHWRCQRCGEKMVVTVLQRLQHENECEVDKEKGSGLLEQNDEEDQEGCNASSPTRRPRQPSLDHLRKLYHCDVCGQDFSFTNTEILKHRKSHRT